MLTIDPYLYYITDFTALGQGLTLELTRTPYSWLPAKIPKLITHSLSKELIE